MSGEQIIGSISWSPDFKSSPPNEVQKLLDEGKLRMAPRWEGEKLVSVDLVKGPVAFEPVSDGPEPQEAAPDVRPHQVEPMKIPLLFGGMADPPQMEFTYTNWKGATKTRRALFSGLSWGCNEYHPEPQFLIDGYDLDKESPRTFALRDISDLRRI